MRTAADVAARKKVDACTGIRVRTNLRAGNPINEFFTQMSTILKSQSDVQKAIAQNFK